MYDQFTHDLIRKALNQKRHIIHIDMDCFYAAVEMRDDPSLKNLPIAVGGKSKRSVLCTSNYIARKFGVRSAMPSMMALKLCPMLKILPGRYDIYKEESRRIHDIFLEFTDIIQPLSLDEAFLDVTESPLLDNNPAALAEQIRKRIFKETRLTASAGIAPNKFLAKVASDWNKPDGQLYIPVHQVIDFVEELPLEMIPGVGPVTSKKLERMGLSTCGDVQEKTPEYMDKYYGKYGPHLHQLSYGFDPRPVKRREYRKSLSVETTFSDDIEGWSSCLKEVTTLIPEVSGRMMKFKKKKNVGCNILKSLAIKVKFHDFQTITVEKSRPVEFFSSFWKTGEWDHQLQSLLESLLRQGLEKGGKPVRLLGIGFKIDESKVDEGLPIQLNLFP